MASSSITLDPERPVASKHDPYAALRRKPYRYFRIGRAVFMIGSGNAGGGWQRGWRIYERLGSKLALADVGLVTDHPDCFFGAAVWSVRGPL